MAGVGKSESIATNRSRVLQHRVKEVADVAPKQAGWRVGVVPGHKVPLEPLTLTGDWSCWI